MTDAPIKPGHNKPPVIPPTNDEMLDDLKRRYPEIETELTAFETALATYPKALTLADEEVAAALQDLLSQMKKKTDVWDTHRKSEKKPWTGLGNIVQNFFTTPVEKIDKLLAAWRPIHQQFLDLKKQETERLAREEADRQREAADRAKREAEEAEERQRIAEQNAENARREEAEARQRADDAKREKEAADERARLAAIEEDRIAKERKEKERAEKAANVEMLRIVRPLIKQAGRLHILCEADEANDEEVILLDQTIAPGGTLSASLRKLAASTVTDLEQAEFIRDALEQLKSFIIASDARFNKREQKKREKARADQEERDRKAEADRLAERQRLKDAEDEAKRKREEAELEAERAKGRVAVETAASRDAREQARTSSAEAKTHGKAADHAEQEADRADNRADRITSRMEKATDADKSRTRGELGSVGSITGRWTFEVFDRAALQRHFGQIDPKTDKPVENHLGSYLTDDAADGAVYRYMTVHRSTFTGERVTGMLPGVVFVWQRDTMIR